MRWISGGPDLPPELLQSLEDGKLVFFCGAGVSYPAGLPTFRGLAEEVYARLRQPLEGLELIEFKKQNYDRAFGLLERRIGVPFVRRTVIEILHLDPVADLQSHKALLTLATSRDNVCHLVTTNFDRGFEFAAAREIAIDAAPKLTIPKLGVWNSVIHLHGIINDKDPDGRSLVLTSADFGTAYLTERWASRFVSELFRRFTILFVGYSVEDPVIRYMMDAFAADRALGEGVGRAYVLAGTSDADRKENLDAWEAKGIIPVLYDETNRHTALHLTLARWADCHRSGLLGKESIIRDHCSSKRPMKPFADDPVVSQVLWAISEPTGYNANVFARLDPVPPLEWLEVFVESGLLNMPFRSNAPSSLVDAGHATRSPDPLHPVTRALGGWLTLHLDNTALLDWVLRSGSSLHPEFREAVQRRLNFVSPVQYGLTKIWQVLTLNPSLIWQNVRYPLDILDEQLSAGIWDLRIKHELLAALAPEFELRPSLTRTIFPDLPVDATKTSSYAEAEIVIRSRDYGSLIREAIEKSPSRQSVLSDLSDDLTGLLRTAMELFEMVQKANAKLDSTYSDQPSISPHAQNSALRTWTVLIELLRDAWKQLLSVDRSRARRVVERWRTIPYPIFRRFCFYAMAESDLHSPQECLAYLLENDGWWLWSIYVYREQFKLLKSLWPKLSAEEVTRLASAITAGPPRAMFREETEEGLLRKLSDRSIWLHLAKLTAWGYDLPAVAVEALRDLSAKYPVWELADGDRDEFPVWMEEGVGEPPVENEDEFLNGTDESVEARLSALRPHLPDDLRKWQSVVASQPLRASRLLSHVAETGQWPEDLWESLLQGFITAKLSAEEWPRFIGALLSAPDSLYEQLVRPIAWLLHDVASILGTEADGDFWKLWNRVQRNAFREDEDELAKDPITRAINIPAGLLTQAILDRLAAGHPRSATEIPDTLWAKLAELSDGTSRTHTYARVVLASRLGWLHMVNAEWVEEHLLPFFDWERSTEASAIWQGYLWQARVTPELWKVIKKDFLLAFHEKQRLGAFEEQISTLFGYVCIDQPDWLSTEETRNALRMTDAKGRAANSRVVFRHLQGAADKCEAMWRTLVGPWLDRSWPKDRALVDPHSALNLALAAVHTGGAFESAVHLVEPFLTESENYSHVVDHLVETSHPEEWPAAALRLLDVVDTAWIWPDRNLRDLLMRLLAAEPGLAGDHRFRRLDEYLLRHNF
jgi:hypothetical protein